MLAKCPWCHATFETDRYGRQFCPRCGAEIDLPPPSSGREDSLRPAPWEDRERLGFFPALWQTWVEATFRPTRFFSTLAPHGVGPAFFYALIAGSIGSVIGALWASLWASAWPGSWSNQYPTYGAFPAFSVLQVVLAPVWVAIAIWINAAVVHVCCLIFGCARRGFDATFRAVAYATGPAVFAIVPFCGSAVASVWVVVLEIIAIQHLQRTTTGRAVGAVLLPVLAVFFCACLGVFLAGMAGAMGAWAATTP